MDAIIDVLVGLVGAAWVTDDHAVLVEMHGHLRVLVEDTPTPTGTCLSRQSA